MFFVYFFPGVIYLDRINFRDYILMCPIITLTLIGGGSTARMQRSVFITDWTQFRALFPVLVVSDEGGYTVVVLAVTRV